MLHIDSPRADAPKLVTPWTVAPAGDSGTAADDEPSMWTGRTVPTPWPAAYGGDLSVGALAAIMRTVASGQHVHSLQLAFLRPGDRERPVEYSVERVRDGYRYAYRAIRVAQDGELIAIGAASLRTPGKDSILAGTDEPSGMGVMSAPETLRTAAEAIEERDDSVLLLPETAALDEYWARGRALDTRHIDPPMYGASVAPRTHNRLWVRFVPSVDLQRQMLESRSGRAALIAYLADDTILEPALASQGFAWRTPGLFSTTVQQNLWFHADFDPGEWLYFDQKLVSRAGDHVVCEGSITDRRGSRVATVLQEGIVKVR